MSGGEWRDQANDERDRGRALMGGESFPMGPPEEPAGEPAASSTRPALSDALNVEGAMAFFKKEETARSRAGSSTRPPAGRAPPGKGKRAGARTNQTGGGELVKRRLTLNVRGKPRNNLSNLNTILTLDPRWAGALSFCTFDGEIYLGDSVPIELGTEVGQHVPSKCRFEDYHGSRIVRWIQDTYGLHTSTRLVCEALVDVAHNAEFHPVREYLRGLSWDGRPRIDTFFTDYFGAEDTHLNRQMGRRWLVSAVSRVMPARPHNNERRAAAGDTEGGPGGKVDAMPILAGEQQAGKSTGLEAICPRRAWFGDALPDMGTKDARSYLRGMWIVEAAELKAFEGRSQETAKAFLSQRIDRFRPAYAAREVDWPRAAVFAGTTNRDTFLSDPSGARRFWPVRVCKRIDVDRIALDRDQLWAEAVTEYLRGALWWFESSELREEQARAAEGFQTAHVWRPQIEAYVQKHPAGGFTMLDLLTDSDGLGMEIGHAGKRVHQNEVGDELRKMGWNSKQRMVNGVRAMRWYPLNTR